jgi:O-antigen biosynthesis protein
VWKKTSYGEQEVTVGDYGYLRRLAAERGQNSKLVAAEKDFQDAVVVFHYVESQLREQVASLTQALAERNGQIASLTQALAERNGQIASLTQALAEREGQVASLTQALAEREGVIQRQSDDLRAKGEAVVNLQAAVGSKDEAVANLQAAVGSKNEAVANLQAILATKDASILEQQRELQSFRTSKLQRLRSTILYDQLSARKLIKIVYLVTALATPERVRRSLRPMVHRLKRLFDPATQRGPKIERPRQKKWPETRPLISVVIPSFNYGRYVEEAVDSVLSQTFQDFEIIVIEGGSTDDTPHILRSFQKPKTKVYLREERHLLGDNRNFGISRSRGKYICCLDADDKLRPTYLEKALFLLETCHYDIASTSVQCFGGSNLLWQVAVKPSLEEITRGNQFSVVAVFRKDLWKKAGGYHDWGLGKDYVVEDWDLWVRMMALGARAINIPEALMLYRVHDASLSKQAHVRPWEEHGKEILKFNKKHLKPKNYLLSAKKNAAILQVSDPYLNLVASYRKETRKPSILLALPFVTTGGADTVFLGLAQHLTASGFNLAVMTTIPIEASFGDNTAKYEAITKQIYHLHQFLTGESGWKDFVFYLIETRNIDILLLAGSAYVYALLPEIKQRFPRLKIVDHLFNEYGHIENNRKYASLIDAHIVVNEVIKRVLINLYGEAEGKIRVIPPGVDVENRFNPLSFNEGGSELSALLPQNKFLVSFIGRFSEEKCPEQFVEMASFLREENNLHFLMLGNGPEYPRVKEKIQALSLEDRIYAPGNVTDVRPCLRISGVVVIPSAIEGLPVTLMESMAFGVPVIASAVGGVPSVIRDEFNGFVCQPSDIQGFVRNIRRLARDDGLCKAMKANAREYALRHFNVDKTNREYSNVFLELLRACQS